MTNSQVRIQKLIKLGEWIEQKENVFKLAATVLYKEWINYIEDNEEYCEYFQALEDVVNIFDDMKHELKHLQIEPVLQMQQKPTKLEEIISEA